VVRHDLNIWPLWRFVRSHWGHGGYKRA